MDYISNDECRGYKPKACAIDKINVVDEIASAILALFAILCIAAVCIAISVIQIHGN